MEKYEKIGLKSYKPCCIIGLKSKTVNHFAIKGEKRMIVSTKGRYALRVMIDLAEHQSDKYVPLKEVAARQEISEKYLENILKVLVQNGFLEGLRGKGGGYRLTRGPEQYTVEEILNLTEGNLATVSCLTPGAPTCHRMAECRTYNMWKGLDEMISDYFSKITLADLAAPEEAGNDYVI
jgi:Rrf2 family iron-sulfur cluster assembly transcriptional regulator